MDKGGGIPGAPGVSTEEGTAAVKGYFVLTFASMTTYQLQRLQMTFQGT